MAVGRKNLLDVAIGDRIALGCTAVTSHDHAVFVTDGDDGCAVAKVRPFVTHGGFAVLCGGLPPATQQFGEVRTGAVGWRIHRQVHEEPDTTWLRSIKRATRHPFGRRT